MSRSVLWTTAVFIVFSFAALMVFFWVRDGSLEKAGASMDRTLSDASHNVVDTTGKVVDGASNALQKATDGDKRT
jgi:hypothetical protein